MLGTVGYANHDAVLDELCDHLDRMNRCIQEAHAALQAGAAGREGERHARNLDRYYRIRTGLLGRYNTVNRAAGSELPGTVPLRLVS